MSLRHAWQWVKSMELCPSCFSFWCLLNYVRLTSCHVAQKNNFIYQPVAIRQLQFLILEWSRQNREYVDQTHNPAKQERASSKWTSNCYVHCTMCQAFEIKWNRCIQLLQRILTHAEIKQTTGLLCPEILTFIIC